MTFEEYVKKVAPHVRQESIDYCKDWTDKVHACYYLGIRAPARGEIEEDT